MPLPHLSLDKLRTLWYSKLPFFLFAIKSALAAGLSWQIISSLFEKEAAALAVVSSVIVVQITSWQTILKGIERAFGVIVGVSLAVVVTLLFGLNFGTITVMIFLAQVIGLFLQNRGQYIATQIPISATLVLVVGATSHYPFLRILGTIIGGLIGIIISLLFSSRIYVLRTQNALIELITKVADAIPRLATSLAAQLSTAESREVYISIRELEQQVHVTEEAYSLGVDSTRLNPYPWARRARCLLIDYPNILQTLERFVRQMRRIAYTITEPESAWLEFAQKQNWILAYVKLIEEMGDTLRLIVAYISSSDRFESYDFPGRENLWAQLKNGQQQLRSWREQLMQDTKQIEAQTADTKIPPASMSYPLAIHGAILIDLRRMLDEVLEIIALIYIPPSPLKK
jgi:uncharacterized membrane protein YgaE (UPF0421/DUF939 family)